MIFLHGCGGLFMRGGLFGLFMRGFIEPGELDWAGQLTRRGHAVLMVDSFGPRQLTRRGHAVLMVDSFGPRHYGEMYSPSGFDLQLYRNRARDAYGALLFLQAQPFVRPDRVGLIGLVTGRWRCSLRDRHAELFGERKERWAAMMKVLERNDITAWRRGSYAPYRRSTRGGNCRGGPPRPRKGFGAPEIRFAKRARLRSLKTVKLELRPVFPLDHAARARPRLALHAGLLSAMAHASEPRPDAVRRARSGRPRGAAQLAGGQGRGRTAM